MSLLKNDDIQRIKKFIANWKKEDIRFAESIGFDDNGEYEIKVPELRKLTMESEEDEWFVRHSIHVPKPPE